MNRSLEEINLNMSVSFTHGHAQGKIMSLAERPSNFSYGNILASIFIKLLLMHLILMKLAEIIFLENQFLIGDISLYSIENITQDESVLISDLTMIKITILDGE